MGKFLIGVFSFVCLIVIFSSDVYAQDERVFFESVTFEGGPVATKHLQFDDENFRERHGLAILKASTREYGNWALYFLNPNSVDDTSFGAGYVTDPYVIPLGPTQLELTGALGLVTGYQDYPVPLLAGQARLQLFEYERWNVGVSVAANPYYTQDEVSNDNEFGVVMTSPFLSMRYSF